MVNGAFNIRLWAFVVMPSIFFAQEVPSKIVQEVESAEVFLEDYTDEFQEKFFEALKQKGIENYDRTINLLLECQTLQPENTVVLHELALAYWADKQWAQAQQSALAAVRAEPENFWYLHTLMRVLQEQAVTLESLSDEIALDNPTVQQHLVKIYIKSNQLKEAKAMLKKLPNSALKEQLQLQIAQWDKQPLDLPLQSTDQDQAIKGQEDNGAQLLEEDLEKLIKSEDFEQLAVRSQEALETYPLQPYFYFAKGMALAQLGKPNEAVSILEAGLDFIFEESSLSQRIYQKLVQVYKSLGNSTKANEYLAKLKGGI